MGTNFTKVVDFIQRVSSLKRSAGLQPTSLAMEYTLIQEEFNELSEAFKQFQTCEPEKTYDLHLELIKESVDLLYVVYGLFALLEVDADKAFSAVHENNMNKFDGAMFREDGKLIKPANFVKMTSEDLARAIYGS